MTDERVLLMTWEERGMYVWLLCHSWLEVGIPIDGNSRARLLRISPQKERRVWGAIGPCWEERDGRLVQPKQEEIRAELLEYRDKQSRSGKAGAAKRWGGAVANGVAIAMAMAALWRPATDSPLRLDSSSSASASSSAPSVSKPSNPSTTGRLLTLRASDPPGGGGLAGGEESRGRRVR
ncbi:MAG: YdaU family protein [bacterium]|nr:YdaU family protein [bacterium]